MGNQVIVAVLEGVAWFLNIFTWLIIINALLSWVLDPNHQIRMLISRIIDPVIRPFRALTRGMSSSTMPIDFSPILAYVVLLIIIKLLERLQNLLVF